jgi:hypothetical protein
MLWAFFFIPIIALGNIPILESDCTPTDIRSLNPSIREHLSTPSNQGSIGWCYAFTAADLLSARLGVPVSYTHMAAIYNVSDSAPPNGDGAFTSISEGGIIYEAIGAAVKQGQICSLERVPYDQSIEFLRSVDSARNNLSTNENLINCPPFQGSLGGAFEANLSMDLAIRTRVLQEDLHYNLNQFFNRYCADNAVTIPELRASVVRKPESQTGPGALEFVRNLNRVLSNGSPVGLSYETAPILSSGSGRHASSIVGRRWRNGVCEYEVRNSWGSSCQSYNASVTECNPEHGSFWIQDTTLFQAATYISFID